MVVKKKQKNITLTTNEILKYNKLKKSINLLPFIKACLYPLYVLFWGALITIVIALAFSVNIAKPMLMIINISNSIYPVIAIYLICILVTKVYLVTKYNQKILQKIVKERRKR